ncbi:MAG: ribbon-helix-helix protein, CopG family [Chloroflexi bacterium]|nr:ribbon-helix-helix protein, CopG family [Chloroflexota bacterium]
MPGTTVRVSERTHHLLRDLAARTGEPMQAIIERAIEDYRRRRFFEEVNAAYAAERRDPVAWAAEEEERALWEATLADGLDTEDWETDGSAAGGSGRG